MTCNYDRPAVPSDQSTCEAIDSDSFKAFLSVTNSISGSRTYMQSRRTYNRLVERDKSHLAHQLYLTEMDQALQKLEEQLRCPICLQEYSEPKVLKCNHVFCKKCLARMWKKKNVKNSEYAINCPSCRKNTTLGHHSCPATLKTAFHINCLLDLKEIFERVKNEENKSASILHAGESEHSTEANNNNRETCSLSCQTHTNKEFELFCDTCKSLICSHCVFRGQEHHTHNYQMINEAFPHHLQEITTSMEPLNDKLTLIEKEMVKTDKCRTEIIERQTSIQEQIRREMRGLRKILESREEDLISTLNDMSQKKLRGVTSLKDKLVQSHTQITTCMDFMKEKLDKESRMEIIRVKPDLLQQTEELRKAFDSETDKLRTHVDMSYTGNPDLKELCENFGKVVSPGFPCADKTLVTGKGLIEPIVGELQTITVQAINSKFRPCEEPIDSFHATLTSEITQETNEATVSIENQKLGMYAITFCPNVQGEHKLDIMLDNHHIKESPFTIHARLHKCYVSSAFLTMRNLAGPQGIAIAENGSIYVTEYLKHRVLVLNSRGEELLSFGSCGNDLGQLEYPQGVAIDGNGNILIADSDNHRIQRFSPDGKFIGSVGTKGTGHLQFNCPTDLAFSSKTSRIYVIDTNCRVTIFNSDFTSAGTFGRKGHRDGQFTHPSGVACDSAGRVYVTDCDRHNVQVFSPEGKFLKSMSKTFKFPNGIAIDQKDHIYVADGEISCISHINSEGALVAVYNMQEKSSDIMRRALAVNKSGMVYVCGMATGKEIKIY